LRCGKNIYTKYIEKALDCSTKKWVTVEAQLENKGQLKVVIHVEMPKAAPKKSICHFQKLEMILK